MRVRRRPVVDEYVEDDQVVVFVAGQVVTLSPLATAALLSVGDTWTEAGEIADRLVAGFGAPPEGADPMAVTRATLETLAGQGLLDLESAALPLAPT